MKVLTFTSLFPNRMQRNLGGFIARRMSFWASIYASQWITVAPVPYFPKLPFGSPWKAYSDVDPFELFKKWQVYHFRYLMLPKIGLPIQGQSMAVCTAQKIRRLILQKGPFDLIDAHFIYPDAFAAMQISRKFGIPLVVSARGSDINYYSQIDAIRPRIKAVLKYADAIIGVSKNLVEKMVSLGAPENRCHHIPNGVDSRQFCPVGNNKEEKPLRNLLAVGNLVPEKGFDLLLKAVSLLKPAYPDIQLKIIGVGPEFSRLSSLCEAYQIKENVRFPGQVDHREIHPWFQGAGIFCLSSLREGNPNVILEALATGIPVAATPVGGVPELIHENRNGVLSHDFSPESLAQAIGSVLERNWSAKEIRKTVLDKTWESVARDLQTIFKKVSHKKLN
nr:glycosyltransferase family 4 protein [Desulfobacula sp.]